MTMRKEVSDVFGSQPRVGGKYWWERDKEIETGLLTLFEESTSKKVIILDGPTGAGKTSLAYRTLFKSKASYNYIAVDDDTNWKTFCRGVLSIPKHEAASDKRKLGFSIRSYLPTGSDDTEHTASYDALKDLEYVDRYLEQITTDTLVEAIIRDDTALIIDDFEKANNELVKKIANLAKKLSNPSTAGCSSKMIIISCRRSFEDIIDVDDTLDGRIYHITLGGLKGPKESWGFLCKGFNYLEIKHPSNSGLQGEKGKEKDCARYAYDATGGILKNLTELGEKMARKSYRNRSLKSGVAINLSKQAAQENIDKYVRRLDTTTELVSKNEHVESVINYLYANGITISHAFADIQSDIERKHPEVSVESGISTLINHEYLVPTGMNGSKVFVRKPNYALAFSVARYRADQYRVLGAMKEKSNQANLPLIVEWDNDD